MDMGPKLKYYEIYFVFLPTIIFVEDFSFFIFQKLSDKLRVYCHRNNIDDVRCSRK